MHGSLFGTKIHEHRAFTRVVQRIVLFVNMYTYVVGG
jgi:hypothetical protein